MNQIFGITYDMFAYLGFESLSCKPRVAMDFPKRLHSHSMGYAHILELNLPLRQSLNPSLYTPLKAMNPPWHRFV